MSARAIGFSDTRAAKFWSATIGKKVVMAVSGAALVGFVVGHMVGNLQVFLGRDAFNAYAAFLREKPALLLVARLGLIVVTALHVWASIQLALLNKLEARPVGYVKKKNVGSTYASRTMYWSGPIIGAFVVYHLMHFTWGIGGTRFVEGEAYQNLVAGFQVPVISIFYIVAMGLLLLHLYHGVWSMFQTLGMNHPRYTPLLKRFAQVLSLFLFVGFSAIPLAVMTGFLK
jgi:succinate dehydrogenase / fumarate reductase, cytochrome b subunit